LAAQRRQPKELFVSVLPAHAADAEALASGGVDGRYQLATRVSMPSDDGAGDQLRIIDDENETLRSFIRIVRMFIEFFNSSMQYLGQLSRARERQHSMVELNLYITTCTGCTD
jgi:hypothetical protein